jgi:hypothetical protein
MSKKIQPNQSVLGFQSSNSTSYDDIVEAFSKLLIEHENTLFHHDDATSILQNHSTSSSTSRPKIIIKALKIKLIETMQDKF